MKRALAILSLLFATFFATSASAEEAKKEWYGYQLILSDVAAGAILYGGGAADNKELLWASLFAYAAVPPVIHALNGETGKAALSPALRLGGPMAGAGIGLLLGFSATVHRDGLEPIGGAALGAAIGAGVGALAGMVIDYALATKKVEAKREEARFRVVPLLSPSHVGVSGMF